MERICLEWNINCGNDAKNDYKDDHEVRCEHYKLDNGKYRSVYECEYCDYKHTEIVDVPDIIQWELSAIPYEEITGIHYRYESGKWMMYKRQGEC